MSRSKDECKPVLNWEKKILLDSFLSDRVIGRGSARKGWELQM